MSTLRVKDVQMYSHIDRYAPINFTLEQGSTTIFTGPCGSGKSYLLELCAAVKTPNTGSILLDNCDLKKFSEEKLLQYRKRNGVVLQQPTLISFLPVYENIALPLRYHKRFSPDKIDLKVKALLKQFEIEKLSNHLPERLSSGQRRMVAIARAIITQPSILFLDDPTDSLDPIQESNIIDILKIINMVKQTTIVIATDKERIHNELSAHFIYLDGKVASELTSLDDLKKKIDDTTNKFEENRKDGNIKVSK